MNSMLIVFVIFGGLIAGIMWGIPAQLSFSAGCILGAYAQYWYAERQAINKRLDRYLK
jgi:hypothetical protein